MPGFGYDPNGEPEEEIVSTLGLMIFEDILKQAGPTPLGWPRLAALGWPFFFNGEGGENPLNGEGGENPLTHDEGPLLAVLPYFRCRKRPSQRLGLWLGWDWLEKWVPCCLPCARRRGAGVEFDSRAVGARCRARWFFSKGFSPKQRDQSGAIFLVGLL